MRANGERPVEAARGECQRLQHTALLLRWEWEWESSLHGCSSKEHFHSSVNRGSLSMIKRGGALRLHPWRGAPMAAGSRTGREREHAAAVAGDVGSGACAAGVVLMWCHWRSRGGRCWCFMWRRRGGEQTRARGLAKPSFARMSDLGVPSKPSKPYQMGLCKCG